MSDAFMAELVEALPPSGELAPPNPGPPARTRAAEALDAVEAAAMRLIVPPPRLVVSDWLDEHRVIGRDYPSPFPGPWRTSRTPYLREPMDAFVDPEVETIVLLFSSQVGKSEALLGMLLYAYGVDPGPGMLVMPTLELAASVSTDRVTSALKTCAALKVGSQKGRASDSAILHKRINGLPLTISGANSPASLSSRPVRNLFGDEIDRWPATTPEGDPLSLAKQRTAAFRRRKVVLSSTPTIKGASRIEDFYEQSDQRRLFAPCPRCGEMFVVLWHHVRWDSGQPETAHLVHMTVDRETGEMIGCGGRIEDRERQAMYASAEWRPTAPFTGTRGYKMWAVAAPWVRLSEMVASFLKAKERPETLQSWINLTLGESWEPPSEKVETASLLMRREQYPPNVDVPAGAKVLTAGVDTQDDRLEVLIMGWGDNEESWVIAREPLHGDPDKPEVWRELDELLLRPWVWQAGGSMRVQCALVDAGGHRTSSVYAAVVARQHRRVFASFGRDGGDGQLVSSPKTLATRQGNVSRYMVDASQAKGLIYSRLRLEDKTGPGVIHFPMTVGDAFMSELTAEELRTERNKWGVPSKRWAMRAGHQRNETLDCFGMALAALRIICPTAARFEALAAKVASVAGSPVERAAAAPAAVPQRRTQDWNGDD